MASTSSSGSGSPASVQVPASPVSPAMRSSADTCAWYAGQSCVQPRSCFDCLNVAVSEGQCALGPRGECVTEAAYDNYVDTRKGTSYLFAPDATYFLSENATYCGASDATCANCKAQWLQDYASGWSLYSTSLCTGSGGCVCLAACELPNWQVVVTDTQCVASESHSSWPSSRDFWLGAGLCVAMVVVFTLISTVVGKLVRKIDSTGQRTLVHRGAPVRRPQLDLAGWMAMREKLMQDDDGACGASLAPPVAAARAFCEAA